MIVSEYLGEPLTHQKITPGNTATGFNVNCYKYLRYRINFTDGDVELTVGSWIVGASSGAVSKIVEVNADTGTWTNNTGYIIVDSWNGTAWTNAEEIKQAAQATAANVSGLIAAIDTGYPYKGCMAKAALVSAYANTELVCFDGSTPDQTALVGQPMAAASSIILADINQIRNFKAIDYTASSAGIIQATFFF
jgi:prophage DNA circulation protein